MSTNPDNAPGGESVLPPFAPPFQRPPQRESGALGDLPPFVASRHERVLPQEAPAEPVEEAMAAELVEAAGTTDREADVDTPSAGEDDLPLPWEVEDVAAEPTPAESPRAEPVVTEPQEPWDIESSVGLGAGEPAEPVELPDSRGWARPAPAAFAPPSVEEPEEVPEWLNWLDTGEAGRDAAAESSEVADAEAAPIDAIIEPERFEGEEPPFLEPVGEADAGVATAWPDTTLQESQPEAAWVYDAEASTAADELEGSETISEEAWDAALLSTDDAEGEPFDAEPGEYGGAASEPVDADSSDHAADDVAAVATGAGIADIDGIADVGSEPTPFVEAVTEDSGVAPSAGADDVGAPDVALLTVAERLERIATTLRQSSPAELLGRRDADPLELLIIGFALGYSQAEARQRSRSGD
jgi:hypothetical protein